MGNARMVRVIAQRSGIIMVNGRTGEVPKGTILDVDPITAHDYDFLEVIPPKSETTPKQEIPECNPQNIMQEVITEVKEKPKRRTKRKPKTYDHQDIP